MRFRLALLVAAVLAACAEAPKAPEKPAPEPVAEPAPVQSETPKFKNSTLKYLAGRNLQPQPTRPLNVKSKCSHKDAIGTVTKLDLLVRRPRSRLSMRRSA